jgi:hypothetical protein
VELNELDELQAVFREKARLDRQISHGVMSRWPKGARHHVPIPIGELTGFERSV